MLLENRLGSSTEPGHTARSGRPQSQPLSLGLVESKRWPRGWLWGWCRLEDSLLAAVWTSSLGQQTQGGQKQSPSPVPSTTPGGVGGLWSPQRPGAESPGPAGPSPGPAISPPWGQAPTPPPWHLLPTAGAPDPGQLRLRARRCSQAGRTGTGGPGVLRVPGPRMRSR